MVDIESIKSQARAGIEEAVREAELEKFTLVKADLLVRLDEIKSDLNTVDAEIVARTPQPEPAEEPVEATEAPTEEEPLS